MSLRSNTLFFSITATPQDLFVIRGAGVGTALKAMAAEFGFGWTSLQALIRRQTAQFYRLCQAGENRGEAHGQTNPLLGHTPS